MTDTGTGKRPPSKSEGDARWLSDRARDPGLTDEQLALEAIHEWNWHEFDPFECEALIHRLAQRLLATTGYVPEITTLGGSHDTALG